MSLFSIIGHFFSDLFSASQKAWDKLPKNVQQGLLNGSGILNIINQGINANPVDVAYTIEQTYPEETHVFDGLLAIAKVWGLVKDNVPADLPSLIALIQAYLKQLSETEWPAVISGMAGLMALILSGGSPYEIIASLLQFVYSTFIKSKPVQILIAPAAPNPANEQPAQALSKAGVETTDPDLNKVAANLGNQALGGDSPN